MQAKYIRWDTGLVDAIIIFPDFVQHRDMAAGLHGKIISAGFINPETLNCYGKSISLDLKSLPEDSDLARRQYRERD